MCQKHISQILLSQQLLVLPPTWSSSHSRGWTNMHNDIRLKLSESRRKYILKVWYKFNKFNQVRAESGLYPEYSVLGQHNGHNSNLWTCISHSALALHNLFAVYLSKLRRRLDWKIFHSSIHSSNNTFFFSLLSFHWCTNSTYSTSILHILMYLQYVEMDDKVKALKRPFLPWAIYSYVNTTFPHI